MSTKSLFLSESQISAWPDVGVYIYDSERMTTSPVIGYSPSSAEMALYEVSVINESLIDGIGSWWLFTATTPPSSWTNNGGTEPLRATGSIPTTLNGSTVLRPSVLFWWIPAWALESSSVSPTILSGTVMGEFPQLPPNPSAHPE